MHVSQRISIAVVAITAMLLSSGVGLARPINGGIMAFSPTSSSYSGNYPITISHAKVGNGTYCLTLQQTGKNSGSASVVMGSQTFSFGTFQIFNHTIVTTISAQGYGQNAGLVFIGSAHRGTIGPGVFDEVYGGEAFVEGALSFGMKGGC